MDAQRRRWSPESLGVAVLAGALLTGCGGNAASGEDAASASTAPAALTEEPFLVGTWETGPIPPERLRATYVDAGGTEQAAADFIAEFDVEQSVRFRIEVTEDGWTQYEIGDDTAPVPGWVGTYTMDGSTVNATDPSLVCRIDYGVELDGDVLSLTVLRDEGESPECANEDFLAQKTIYESAPFTRAP